MKPQTSALTKPKAPAIAAAARLTPAQVQQDLVVIGELYRDIDKSFSEEESRKDVYADLKALSKAREKDEFLRVLLDVTPHTRGMIDGIAWRRRADVNPAARTTRQVIDCLDVRELQSIARRAVLELRALPARRPVREQDWILIREIADLWEDRTGEKAKLGMNFGAGRGVKKNLFCLFLDECVALMGLRTTPFNWKQLRAALRGHKRRAPKMKSPPISDGRTSKPRPVRFR